MLDDDHSRFLACKFCRQFERGVGIVQVVVGQLLALKLRGLRNACGAGHLRDIDRGLLVRVFAIAQRVGALEGEGEGLGEQRGFIARGRREGKPAGDRGVIGGGAGIGLARHAGAESLACRAAIGVHFRHQRGIVRRIGEDRHEAVVLRRRAHHRRPANVDILDHFRAARALGDGRLEGVEVDHHQIDRPDPVGLHRSHVLRVVAQRQQPAVNRGVEGLDPPVHHFGKAGQLRDVLHRKACVAERLGGAAGAHQFNPARCEACAKFSQTALVGH